MPLAAGTRIGHYEIAAPLGAGGMGEVYRAHDVKLKRDVALKVLPAGVAADPERLARFQREAEVLASLNHPHIAQIFGVENAALVMELVDGEDLAKRLRRGAIPQDEALAMAQQIVDAIECAHDAGVIHRDLKPANIKVRPDGTVKVLDFGLAKALDPGTGPSASGLRGMVNSPTITWPTPFDSGSGRPEQDRAAITARGVILGTAAYMSPEQAKGKAVDTRADIWAFGCVLYEMLTGRRAFQGEDVTDTLTSVMRDTPDWSALPAGTPASIRALLRRCLTRDHRKRMPHIAVARLDIEDALAPAAEAVREPAPRSSRIMVMAGWVVAAACLGAVTLAIAHLWEPAAATPRVFRFQFAADDLTQSGIVPVVSPDGSRVAFTLRNKVGKSTLWVQGLDALEPTLVPDAQNPYEPFWSPDSRFIAYGSGAQLKRIDPAGGAAVTLADIPGGEGALRGGAWGPKGVLLLSVARHGLLQVSETGGVVSPVSTLDTGTYLHVAPAFLPDGRHFLFLKVLPSGQPDGLYVGSLDNAPDAQTSRRLIDDVRAAQYAPGPGRQLGHVVYQRDGTLLAQSLDPVRLELVGEGRPLAEQLSIAGPRAFFSVSADTLVYRRGDRVRLSELAWFDRKGQRLARVGSPGSFDSLDVSSDGKLAAVVQSDPQTRAFQLWSIDLDRGVFTRVNPGTTADSAPAIASDGVIAFTMFMLNAGGSVGDLYVRAASGAGESQSILQSPALKHANDWSPDRRYLIYDEHHNTRRQDLWLLPMAGDRTPIPVLATSADETLARFSPDGKRVVYRSDESGQPEIYVRDFAPERSPPIGVGKWTVSNAGGDNPRWSPDGREIYYIAPDRMLMSVPVTRGATFQPGRPVPLFETSATGNSPYDVTADGRILINSLPASPSSGPFPVTVVLNWQTLLTAR